MKKIPIMLACIIISIILLSVNLYAASCGVTCTETPGINETFKVNVTLNENPGIRSIMLRVSFPTDNISLENCTDNKLFDTFYQYIDPSDPGCLLLSFSTAADTDNYSTGSVAEITFEAIDTSSLIAIISVECEAALNNAGEQVAFDGISTIVTFAEEEIEEVPDEVEEGDEILDDEETLDDEEVLDEEIIEDEEAVTEATTKKTEAATKTEKTSEKTTEKTSEKTSQTTTEATVTTTESIETLGTAPAVTEAPESSESETAPTESSPVISSSDSAADNMATGNDYEAKASKSTIVLAVSIVITVIVFVVGIEVYKRFFSVSDENEE